MLKPNVQKYMKAIVEQAKEQSGQTVSNYQVIYRTAYVDVTDIGVDSILKLHPTNSMVQSCHLHTRTNFKHATRCTSTYTQNTNKTNFNMPYTVSTFHTIAGCHTQFKSPKFFANQQHSTTKYKHTAIGKHKCTIITNSVCFTPEHSHTAITKHNHGITTQHHIIYHNVTPNNPASYP
uniref:Uncharacterized protein n=1 Tax=Magallana gigas TaxID=29159 RepID=K1QSV9_MAGGI